MSRPIVSITIDTEEDNWGAYEVDGATSANILELPRFQEIAGGFGARPTYLVNYAPLVDSASVAVLGELSSSNGVEVGVHCHPWNTPPYEGAGVENSMMFRLSPEVNRAKIGTVRTRIISELGQTPVSFRSGRWGMGTSVALVLEDVGLRVDSSISSGVDWTSDGGADFSAAPRLPYRFDPARPTQPDERGSLVELPPTIGTLRGNQDRALAGRNRLEGSIVSRLGIVGALDRLGVFTRRWLSPETSNASTMIRLTDALMRDGHPFLNLTFHSVALLPGATPFVRTSHDRERFLKSIAEVLGFLDTAGCRFATLDEAASLLFE